MSQQPQFLIELSSEETGYTLRMDASCKWSVEPDDRIGKMVLEMLESEYDRHKQYEYSPADGYPGYAFAQRYAKNNDYVLKTNPPPPAPKGAIF